MRVDGASRIVVHETDGAGWVPQVLEWHQFGGTLALSSKVLAATSLSPVHPDAKRDWRGTVGIEEIQVFRRQDDCAPRAGDCWRHDATLTDADPRPRLIGSMLAADGDRLVVAAATGDRTGELRVYRRSDAGWSIEHQERTARVFAPPALRAETMLVALDAPTVYEHTASGWKAVAALAIPDPSVDVRRRIGALDVTSNRAIVSAGGVHVFGRGPQGQWSWEARLEPDPALHAELAASVPLEQGCNVTWGHGVALDGDRAFVSFTRHNCPRSGVSAVVYERHDGVFRQVEVVEYAHPFLGIGMWLPFAAEDGVLVLGSANSVGVLTRRPEQAGGRYGGLEIPGVTIGLR
ncbi:hypothetical protein A7982_12361 [Minicystis rosea]|nr:hypothetical protein A7982_12361 [Minicystis rosea]